MEQSASGGWIRARLRQALTHHHRSSSVSSPGQSNFYKTAANRELQPVVSDSYLGARRLLTRSGDDGHARAGAKTGGDLALVRTQLLKLFFSPSRFLRLPMPSSRPISKVAETKSSDKAQPISFAAALLKKQKYYNREQKYKKKRVYLFRGPHRVTRSGFLRLPGYRRVPPTETLQSEQQPISMAIA